MKVIKWGFQIVTISLLAFLIFCLLTYILFNYVLTPGENQTGVSEEMFQDSQTLLTMINTQFLTVDLDAQVDEQQVDELLDMIDSYGYKYSNTNLNPAEGEMFTDIGIVVYDYLQLAEIDAFYQGEPLDFNERYGMYSSQKRDIYESFLNNRVGLRETYGFSYEQ
ncbi:hypothetical protein [Bacillus sp. AK128]